MGREKKDTPPRFPAFRDAFLKLMGNMTLEQFAERLGISRATVGFYAAGKRMPDALGIKKIAEKCNVSADWLLGLTDERTPDPKIREICAGTGLREATVTGLMDMKRQTQDEPKLSKLALLDHLIGRECTIPYLGAALQYVTATFEDGNMPVSFDYKDDDGYPYAVDMTAEDFIGILRQMALNSIGEVLDEIRASGQRDWRQWKEEHANSDGQPDHFPQE